MPLQIIKYPDYIYAKAAQELVFRRNNILTTPGRYEIWIGCLDGSSLPGAGDVLTLVWNNSLTAVTWQWGTQIAVYTSGSYEDYTRYMVTQLSRSSIFSKDYIISYLWSDGTLSYFSIKARQPGIYYNLAFPFIPAAVTFSAVSTGADVVEPNNEQLKVYVDILTNDNYEDKVTRYDIVAIDPVLDVDLNRGDFTWYELPDILRCLLGVDLPAWNMPFMHSAIAAKLTFQVFAPAESGYEPAQMLDDFSREVTSPLVALNSGKFNFWDGASAYWLRPASAPNIITPDQPLWLSVYLPWGLADNCQYTLNNTITYNDSSSDHISNDVVCLKGKSFVCIPAGLSQLGIVTGSRVPIRMEVSLDRYIDGTGDHHTQTLTFIYDNRFAQYKRYFVFQNSAGGLDTIVAKGMSEYSTKIMHTTAIHTRTSDTTPATGTITMETNQDERSWTMRTGWLLSISELLYYRELLLSNYVAEVLMVAGLDNSNAYDTPLKSVIVTANSIKEYEEDAGKWSLEWTMKYADDQNVAGDDGVQLRPYIDSWFEATVFCPAGGFGCEIDFDYEGFNMNVIINGIAQGPITSYTFPNNETVLNIVIQGTSCNSFGLHYGSGSVDMQLDITRISVPYSVVALGTDGFTTLNYDYLLRRIPELGIVNLYLITADPLLPIDNLLQLCAANYNSYALMRNLVILYAPRGTTGDDAYTWLTAQGVSVLTL